MFHKIKNIVFNDIGLPTSLETFIERRLVSLKGSALLVNSAYDMFEGNIESQKPNFTHNKKIKLSKNENGEFSVAKSPSFLKGCTLQPLSDDVQIVMDNINYVEESSIIFDHSILNESGVNFCCKGKNVVIPDFGNEDDTVIMSDHLSLNKFSVKNKTIPVSVYDKDKATENWKRKSKRRTKSYLTTNPHLKYLDLTSKKCCKSLPVLKNGSRIEDLKAIQLKGYGKIILTNTCAFDTAVFLIMVAICDSNKYLIEVNDELISSTFNGFVKKILSNGITVGNYQERAQIIINLQNPVQTSIKYDQLLLKCETTFTNILKCVIPDFPTITDHSECKNPKGHTTSYYQYGSITYIYDGHFKDLQNCINAMQFDQKQKKSVKELKQ